MPDVPVADVLGGMLPVAYDMVECHLGMLHSHSLCRLYTLLIHSDFLEAIRNRSDSIPTVLSILMDMLGAAVDTSTSSIEWVQSELMKDPRTMKKLQNELDNVVGKDRKVKESDLDNLGILGHGCRGNLQASSSGSTHIP
ncbi:hypothetical protein ACOSQ3_022250 [Xanthoceras sorbifolium]